MQSFHKLSIDFKFKELSNEQIKQIKSYSEITDLSECIIQLVHNSIDAESSYIQVQIDFDSYSCIVSDNGIGIGESDLNLIGERYITSKLNSINNLNSQATFGGLKTFGYHGESLSNIINLSDQFDLITCVKSSNEKSFYHKQFKLDKQTIQKLIYFKSEYQDLSTMIRVKNLFGKHVLRQKQLKQQSNALISSFLKAIEALSIAHYDIEIVIEDSNEHRTLFHAKANDSIRKKFSSLLGSNSENFLKKFSFKENNYEVNCLINLINKDNQLFSGVNFNSSKIQFIYVNRRFIENRDIYHLVSRELFACKQFNLLKSESKHIIFCLSIVCPFVDYVLIRKSQKTLIEFKNETFFEILKNCIQSFLIKYEFKRDTKQQLNLEENIDLNPNSKYDLKNIRISKKVKNLDRLKSKPKVSTIFDDNKIPRVKDPKSKVLIQLNAVIRKKKVLLGSILTTDEKKRNFSSLRSSFKNRYQILPKNKSTQTEINFNKEPKITPLKLKPNWIAQKNPLGIDFYLNIIDGSTTYDFNQVKLIENSVDYELNQDHLENMKSLLNKFETNEEKFFKDDFKSNIISNEQTTNLNNHLLEKMILVKWRNREEFNKSQRLTNSKSFDNSNNIGTLKLDMSLFDDLKVIQIDIFKLKLF